MAFGVGFVIGLFLALSSAWIMRRAMVLMAKYQSEQSEQPPKDDEKSAKWAIGDALGLASLWISKFVGAGFAVYVAIKFGLSVPWLAGGIPVGIVGGILLLNLQKNKNSP